MVQDVVLNILERDSGQEQVVHKLFGDFEKQNKTLRKKNQKLCVTNADLVEKIIA